ncbi:MAG: hypothetical protein IKN37_03895 [Bacteroidales bacterium]|nr:hypothetical protein [Bacteroidales bacterium]
MKSKVIFREFGLLLWMVVMSWCVEAQVSVWDGTYTPWTKGTGTASDPFLIENARQLAYLANRVNNGLDAGGGHVSNPNYHYKLMVDVNLNGSDTFQWTPIGKCPIPITSALAATLTAMGIQFQGCISTVQMRMWGSLVMCMGQAL